MSERREMANTSTATTTYNSTETAKERKAVNHPFITLGILVWMIVSGKMK